MVLSQISFVFVLKAILPFNENTLIPLYAAGYCIGNEIMVAEDEPLYLGVDITRYGDDASIILPRKACKSLLGNF